MMDRKRNAFRNKTKGTVAIINHKKFSMLNDVDKTASSNSTKARRGSVLPATLQKNKL